MTAIRFPRHSSFTLLRHTKLTPTYYPPSNPHPLSSQPSNLLSFREQSVLLGAIRITALCGGFIKYSLLKRYVYYTSTWFPFKSFRIHPLRTCQLNSMIIQCCETLLNVDTMHQSRRSSSACMMNMKHNDYPISPQLPATSNRLGMSTSDTRTALVATRPTRICNWTTEWTIRSRCDTYSTSMTSPVA